jgi:4-hydroxybenzoate polyprenyltransferase
MNQEYMWGNKTIPGAFGVKGAKAIAISFLLLFNLTVYVAFIEGLLGISIAAGLGLSALPALHFILYADEMKPPLYYKFYGDGVMLIQFIFVFLVTQLV